MKIFILTVAAALISLALAQEYSGSGHDTKVGAGYSSHGRFSHGRFGGHGRFGYGGYGSHQGYGYGYGYKKCPKLPSPENGSVKQSGIYPGSKAVHACDEGYILTGDRVRVCQKDGTFSGEAPTCEPVDCGSPDAPDENGSVDVTDTTFRNIATYSCNEGYWIDVTQGGYEVIICLASGQWSNTAPSCRPVDCGFPPQEDVNGEIDFDETTLGNTATYTCNTGYDLSTGGDSLVSTCLANGEWSSVSAPSCDPVDCGNPSDADENGEVAVDATTFRNTAIYSCNEGYILDDSNGGSQQVECQADGTWSGFAPSCIRINCGNLATPLNGALVFNSDTRLGSTADFTCNRGFRLEGASQRVCEANGDWSLESPSCIRIQCPKLDAPKNGKVRVSGLYVDDYAFYSCGYGFVLTGEYSRRVCQEDGTWSGEAPTCEAKKYYPNNHYGYGNSYGYGHGNKGH